MNTNDNKYLNTNNLKYIKIEPLSDEHECDTCGYTTTNPNGPIDPNCFY